MQGKADDALALSPGSVYACAACKESSAKPATAATAARAAGRCGTQKRVLMLEERLDGAAGKIVEQQSKLYAGSDSDRWTSRELKERNDGGACAL